MSAISERAAELGLGAAAGAEEHTADGRITWQDYAHPGGGLTTLVSSPAGVFEVHGAIRDRYLWYGGPAGPLGAALTDESTTPDTIGRYNHFDGGSVYWTPTTGAHEVHGDIREWWRRDGWERGSLGYPITDELSEGDLRYQLFTKGSLRWLATTGLAGIVRNGCSPNNLLGIADTHCHPAASFGFGGQMMWGAPEGDPALGLRACDPAHGGPDLGPASAVIEAALDAINLISADAATAIRFCVEFFTAPWRVAGVAGNEGVSHVTAGHDAYTHWPSTYSRLHQQMHVDWLRRSWEQGHLKLVVALAVNAELLANLDPLPGVPTTDMASAELQLQRIRDLAAANSTWMTVVTDPVVARNVIASGRLAVVLGVEIDSLGDWHHPEDCTDAQVRELARHLDEDLGVRVVYPVHLSDNAFGGASQYSTFFALNSRVLTGTWQDIRAWDDPTLPGGPVPTSSDGVHQETIEYQSLSALPVLADGVLGPVTDILSGLHVALPGFPDVELGPVIAEALRLRARIAGFGNVGTVNARPLTDKGRLLMQELMNRGLLIDVDHMCAASTQAAIDLARTRHYPLVSGHATFRGLGLAGPDVGQAEPSREGAYLRHESAKSWAHAAAIAELGGYVAAQPAASLVVPDDPTNSAGGRPIVAQDCPGSTTSWARTYLYARAATGGRVTIGTDFNGFAETCTPRFGPQAAHAVDGLDDIRQRAVDGATAGVRYADDVGDLRASRFDPQGRIDDPLLAPMWLAALGRHRADRPDFGAGEDAAAAAMVWDGMHSATLGDCDRLPYHGAAFGFDWGNVCRGAWHAAHGTALASVPAGQQHSVCEKLLTVLARLDAMAGGPNPPLTRLATGNRDWDYNLDGFANYGLFPDFLADAANVGLAWDEQLLDLLTSAETFMGAWERCRDPQRPDVAPPKKRLAAPSWSAYEPVERIRDRLEHPTVDDIARLRAAQNNP